MALLDYQRRMANLRARRFDGTLNESLLSKSFSDNQLPEDLRYMAESMRPLPEKSTKLTIEAASRVQKHLENGFDLPFSRTYKTQGSVMSNTHIKASDFDFLTIIDQYHYTAPDVPILNPYKGSPVDDIAELRKQTVKIMKDTYDIVDDSHPKCISVFNKALNRKVDIVPSFWYNTAKYNSTEDEYYRGVKFKTNQHPADFPFAHIWEVNRKGTETQDGSKMAIRLLKGLKADSEPALDELKSFHITSIVHAIDNKDLEFIAGNEIRIALEVSSQMQKLLVDPIYRKSVKSPNNMETPFEDDGLLADMKSLKADLDKLIFDVSKEIKSVYTASALLKY